MNPGAPWHVLGWMLVAVLALWGCGVLMAAAYAIGQRRKMWREFKRRQDELEENRRRVREGIRRQRTKP
jgi:beta-lactamase regulating signal transducer with metallopeptidase domain